MSHVGGDDPRIAAAVLLPIFDAVRDTFAQARMPDGTVLEPLRKTRLCVMVWERQTDRDLAACRVDTRIKEVFAHPGLADLPVEQVVAVFAHELGHAADFTYPACWRFRGRSHPAEFKPPRRRRPKAVKSWEGRSHDEEEWMADAIAWAVTGKRIRYCGPEQIQCLRGGTAPRPKDLW